jgi:chromosome segregation ATPase
LENANLPNEGIAKVVVRSSCLSVLLNGVHFDNYPTREKAERIAEKINEQFAAATAKTVEEAGKGDYWRNAYEQTIVISQDLKRQLSEAKQEIFDKGARIGGLRIDVAALEHRLSDLRESSKALLEAVEKVRMKLSRHPELTHYTKPIDEAIEAIRQKWGKA